MDDGLAPARPVAEHIWSIELPLPIPELHSVTCYAVSGTDGITLVDPGWASEATGQALDRGLARMGARLDDVVRVLATHHHWDHYTQAVVWQRDRGIPIALGREERHSIAAWATLEGQFPVQTGLLRRAGADELADLVAPMQFEPHEQAMAFDPPARWLDGGESWDLGTTTLTALATPGHTRGHVVFAESTANTLFTGDHVLPRITPSIAYERQPDPHSLRSYLASLRLCLERPDAVMAPAHGDLQPSTHARVEALLAHHDQRLRIVGDLVAGGVTTAFTVAQQMTWTRHERTLADLGTVHGMTAVLEVAAHLDLLELQGHLIRIETEGRDVYAVSSTSATTSAGGG